VILSDSPTKENPPPSERPAPARAEPARNGGALAGAWKIFRSLQFGLFLLLLLGAACVYASLIAADPSLGAEAIPRAKARVYGSPWFLFLLLLFAVQLVISTWPVTLASISVWFPRAAEPNDAADKPFADGCAARLAVDSPGAREAVDAALAAWATRISRQNGRFLARRGLLRRFGPTIVHAGILTVIAGGALWGWMERTGRILADGRWICPEGEISRTLLIPRETGRALGPGNMRQAFLPGGAEIRLLDFDAVTHPHSEQPAEFYSWLEIRERGAARRFARVDMNNSVRVGDLVFHQSAYTPLETVTRAIFEVRDARSDRRIAFADASAFCPVPLPEAGLLLEVSAPSPGAQWAIASLDTPDHPVARGIVESRDGAASPAILSAAPENPPADTAFENAEEGSSSTLEAREEWGSLLGANANTRNDAEAGEDTTGIYRVRFIEPATGFATYLSVVSVNPAIPLLWLGVGAILLGAALTFTIRYREVDGAWEADGRALRISMRSHRRPGPLLADDFASLLRRLEQSGAKILEAPGAPASIPPR